MTLQGDTLGNVLVQDPVVKAGQDPAGGIADALATRATKGPLLVYYSTIAGAPVQLPAADHSVVALDIYGDTIEVTDKKYIIVYVAFFLNFEDINNLTEDANLGLSFEASGNGIDWYPVGVINRVIAVNPATVFRVDTGQSAGALSATGGFADASTTMNAILQEDVVLLLPAPASAVTADVVIQRAYRFLCPNESYIRAVASVIYDGPTDVQAPSLYMAVQVATD